MKTFKINEQLAISILNYLANQRYADVHQLVTAVQNLQPLEEPVGVPNKAENGQVTSKDTPSN